MDEYGSAWFRYRLESGKTQTDSITIANDSAVTRRVVVYPVDATATQGGALAMRNQSEPRIGVGAWINLSDTILTLMPFEHRNLPFALAVPLGTSVGDQVGGIMVEEQVPSSTTTQQGVHIQVVSRLGVRVYETVPGMARPSLEITRFTALPSFRMHFTLTLANTGNVTIQPRGTVVLMGIFGFNREQITLPPLTLLPKRTATVELVSSHGHLLANAGQAKLNLTFGTTHSARTVSYQWLNIAAIGIIIAIITICVAVAITFQNDFISLSYSNNKRGDNANINRRR